MLEGRSVVRIMEHTNVTLYCHFNPIKALHAGHCLNQITIPVYPYSILTCLVKGQVRGPSQLKINMILNEKSLLLYVVPVLLQRIA